MVKQKEMQNNNIEKLAYEACFATEFQVKCRAEQAFYNLCLTITPAQLHDLMNSYSQTVLFVTMEYIEKVLIVVPDISLIYAAVNSSVEAWYDTNSNACLIRGDGVLLQFHVHNSVARSLGQLLKYIYLQKDKQNQLKDFIMKRPNLRYRLFLWKLFIETISIVDNNLTFLVYRTLVYSFQQHIIPQIMDALLPFFCSVREQIQSNELSILQERLSVQQVQNQGNTSINIFNQNQLKFTQLVFQVLHQVICFNYNITYSEYESEIPIENCLVCFPDQVTKKVVGKQFVTSIFYVAQKLINDGNSHGGLNETFLSTTLECIQKIVLTKLFYTSLQTKADFVKTVLICMCKLLDSKKLNESIVLNLIQSNLKLLISVELHFIYKLEHQYHLWMVKIKHIILAVIQSTAVHIDSLLISQVIELTAKIVEESNTPQLKPEGRIFKNFGIEIVVSLLKKLFSQDQSLIGVGKVRSYDDLKKNISQFIKRIRHLSCLNLVQVFQHIEPWILTIFQTNNANMISNVFIFFSEFCDAIVLAKNILYESQQTNAGAELGKFLYICLQWLSKYRSTGESVQIIDISLMIFVEKLLIETLTYFTYEDSQVKITAQIYKIIAQGRPFMSPEKFFTFCYRQIARNLVSGDFNQSSYTFEVLTSLLLKFKWGIRREHFKQTSIAKDFLQLCKQLSESQFDGQTLTLRKQLYKIITNISFDDTLDDYRTNIDQIIRSLEQNLYINRWRVMYDLTGICEAIDTSAIYRYFLIGLEKSKIPIAIIMNQLFVGLETFGNNSSQKIQCLKSILKLQLCIVENKGQRLSSQKNIFYNYKVITSLMPFWAMLLEQGGAQTQQWDQVIIFIYKIVNTLLKNGNTNFFLLQRAVVSYPKFLKLFFYNMTQILKWVEQYPQLFLQFRTTLHNVANHLMEVVFCNNDPEVAGFFNQVLNNFMAMNIRAIETLSNGNKNVQDSLETQLDIVKTIFQYLKNAKKLQHKEIQIKNFPVLNLGIQHKFNYILALFKLGISSSKKMMRILDVICRTINNMDFLAGSMMKMIVHKLGLAHEAEQSLLRIWRETQAAKGQFGWELCEDRFLIQMKQWFKKCNTSTMVEPDY